MGLEEAAESRPSSLTKAVFRETKAEVVCDCEDLHVKDESLLPATLNIFFLNILLFLFAFTLRAVCTFLYSLETER